MTNQFISRDIINNLINVIRLAVQYSPHPNSIIDNATGSLIYYTGSEYPFFNGVFNNYQNDESGILDDMDSICEFFTEKKRSFIWWWTQQSDIPVEIKANLDAKGFQFLGDFLGIAASLEQIAPLPENKNIEIRIVSNDSEYSYFLNIMCEVFQMSETIKTDLRAMYHSYGAQGKFKHYIAYYKGEPAATLTAYIDNHTVGLYNGATLGKFQKNGLCAALAHHAIEEAKALNCSYAISQLMTPGMAKGLSEKMGFKTYCLLLPFLKNS